MDLFIAVHPMSMLSTSLETGVFENGPIYNNNNSVSPKQKGLSSS